ncbi:hypothetical protein H072_4474 [Dactylellina haptotyla CBS 200.50]|uniref:Extracellular membrane protein CFEM domain-containing protein n=1 Tax=Dactylellina haptotyla (strain CBS 200.50) TaxID=1284197 RepID=S8AFB4_DACHA|nr:hypothetical protein H072_4474 [Dactylellina haptotyla CBS 200.50]
MHKYSVILGLTAAVATAQTTAFGNGEHLCYLANDVISRCWTDKSVPATAAPLKDCYCEWTAEFDQDLIGCWEYIQTAVSFISPVETPGIPPYAGYCGPVTTPSSAPATSTLIPPTETTVVPETSTYVSASNPITYIPSNVSASNPITYISSSSSSSIRTYTNPHYNATYTVSSKSVSEPPTYTLIPPTATTVVPRPTYVPDESSSIPPPPVATGGASAVVGPAAALLGGAIAAIAFAF